MSNVNYKPKILLTIIILVNLIFTYFIYDFNVFVAQTIVSIFLFRGNQIARLLYIIGFFFVFLTLGTLLFGMFFNGERVYRTLYLLWGSFAFTGFSLYILMVNKSVTNYFESKLVLSYTNSRLKMKNFAIFAVIFVFINVTSTNNFRRLGLINVQHSKYYTEQTPFKQLGLVDNFEACYWKVGTFNKQSLFQRISHFDMTSYCVLTDIQAEKIKTEYSWSDENIEVNINPKLKSDDVLYFNSPISYSSPTVTGFKDFEWKHSPEFQDYINRNNRDRVIEAYLDTKNNVLYLVGKKTNNY